MTGAAETREPVDDPVETITAEFAKSGAQREDGGIVESSIDDPNFAGVYRVDDEVVVAVVDCGSANVETFTALAGDTEVRVIEVDHNYRKVNDFRDQLAAELRSAGVPADVVIQSTRHGRVIEVRVLKDHEMPADFGSSVPAAVFSVREVDGVFGDT